MKVWNVSASAALAVLSPKSHSYDSIVPSGSEEPEPMKVTSRGALPVNGVAEITAVGEALAVADTVMTFWAIPV